MVDFFMEHVGKYTMHGLLGKGVKQILNKSTYVLVVLAKKMTEILRMEEYLQHLWCIKPCKLWNRLPINWCRISYINSIMRPIIKNPFCRLPSCHDPNPKNPSHILIMYLTYDVKTQVFAGRTETSPTTFRHILSNNQPLATCSNWRFHGPQTALQQSTLNQQPSLQTVEALKIQNTYTPDA